jgi:uncharacterized protein YegP (UPF0339 family)
MKFEMYKDDAGEYRWRLKSSNGQTIAASGEGYKNRGDCAGIIGKIRVGAQGASIVDLDDA